MDSEPPSRSIDGRTAHARQLDGLGRGIGWTYGATAVVAICSLTTVAYTTREAGLAVFGLFSVLTVFITLLQTADLGLSTTVVRAAALRAAAPQGSDEEIEARAQVHAAHSVYVAFAVLVLVLAVACAPVAQHLTSVPRSQVTRFQLAFLMVGVGGALTLATAAAQGVLTGTRRFAPRSLGVAAGAAAGLVVTLVLVPSLGLFALGLANLVAALVSSAVFVSAVVQRERWWRPLPAWPSRSAARRVAGLTLPLLVVSAAMQLVTASDLLVVGAVVGPAAVGAYRVGGTLPTQAVGVLFLGYDVSLPTVSGLREAAAQEDVTRFLTRIVAGMGGLGLGTLLLYRRAWTVALLGHDSRVAQTTLTLFCLIWLCNVVVHGQTMLLIARATQSRIVPVAVAETVGNVGLTLVCVLLFGAVGAAAASLVAVAASNLVAVPLLIRRYLHAGVFGIVVLDGLLPIGGGLAVATCAWVVLRGVVHGLGGAILAAVATLVVGAAVGLAILGSQGRDRARSMFNRLPPDSVANAAHMAAES